MAITRGRKQRVTDVLGALAVATSTVAAWWLWLGWDTEHDIDPVTQSYSGPYEVWQVAGCVLSLVAIAVIGGWLLRPWTVAATMTIAFTVAWSWQADSVDASGLWAVGAILVFAGMAVGSAVFSYGARIGRNMARRKGASPQRLG
jgi:hypothetical protein